MELYVFLIEFGVFVRVYDFFDFVHILSLNPLPVKVKGSVGICLSLFNCPSGTLLNDPVAGLSPEPLSLSLTVPALSSPGIS